MNMKKIFILLLLAVCTTANAWEDNDTLTINKPTEVRIITGDSIQKIKVYGREGDEHYTYESKIQLVDSNYVSSVDINKDSWNFDFVKRHSAGSGYPLERKDVGMRLAFGLCTGIGANYQGPISVGSSWEIMWKIVEVERYGYGKHNGFSAGIGVDWRNFRMDGHTYFTKLDDGTLVEENFPQGYESDFSRIKVFSINFPLMWKYRTKKMTFGLGPVINLNTYASIKNKYWDTDGKKHKDVYKHIHQNPITVDIMAEVNIHNWFGIYGKFSPISMFSSTYGDAINFSPVSFGVIF